MQQSGQRTIFAESDIRGMAPAMKVGILATVDPSGLPHLTLLATLRAESTGRLTFGQFTEGMSKENVLANPRCGFLVMSLQRKLWRGTATWTHAERGGPAFDAYNNEPLFRYNSYFGIHTVHFLDLVEHTGEHALPMADILAAALATGWARAVGGRPHGNGVANGCAMAPWTRTVLSAVGNPKFISWVAKDGFPRIVPLLQAKAAACDQLFFSPLAYGHELAAIPPGAGVAVFGMTLKMEDVLVRGWYEGTRRIGGVRCGVVAVDWVYNSMPPVPGQVYPPPEILAVTGFGARG